MDFSIRPISAEIRRQLGADAFDLGLSLDDHGMNPGAAAIADWKSGWLARHYEVVVEGRQSMETPP